MRSPLILLAPLLILLLPGATTAASSGDAAALLAFKSAADPGNCLAFLPLVENASATHCRWPGVSCSTAGRVVRLVLEGAGITGFFPGFRTKIYQGNNVLPGTSISEENWCSPPRVMAREAKALLKDREAVEAASSFPSSRHGNLSAASSDDHLKDILQCVRSSKSPAVVYYGASWDPALVK